jgi:hypothetical protein
MIIGINNKIPTNNFSPAWLPSDESQGLLAWYRNKVGITLESGTTDVNQWYDSSGNSYHMLQNDTGEQPSYDVDSGGLIFDPSSDTQNLQLQLSGTDTHIELDGPFVIGIKMNPDAVSVVVIGSNTQSNELIKINTGTDIKIENASDSEIYRLDAGNTKDDTYWVIARDDYDRCALYKGGVEATGGEVPAVTGTFSINAIGVRATDNNPFDGSIYEIIFFNIHSDELIANVHNRLSGL